MTLRDFVDISLGNLRRTKLRSALTISGVIIAIATFVAMLSFAAGNHRYFTTAFNEFGLLNQMSVTPKDEDEADSTAAILDDDAIGRISEIPGVRLAYPYASFDVTAAVLDTSITTTARALPMDAVRTKLFTRVLGGAAFSSETAREAIVTNEFVEDVGIDPDSLLGETLIVTMTLASLDSALAQAMGMPLREAQALYDKVDRDSVFSEDYQQRFVKRELADRFQRFFNGLMNRRVTVSDTLTIAGVAPDDREYRFRTAPIVIPERTARRLSSGGFVLDTNPADMMSALRSGRLFQGEKGSDSRSYPRVTLELETLANHGAVKDSIEALGFDAFSFAESFEEVQRFMVYYYAGMSVIGIIALLTASLGIINTLVMSITERRREIGILKSLGAHETDIRLLFLVESAVMGFIGAVVGIAVGWAGTRVVAVVARRIMEREDMPVFDPFALPLWLVAVALAFGVLVSLIAGLYPAARAARVDPVEALRTD